MVIALLLILFLAACNLPQSITITIPNVTTDPGIVATKVAMTLQALTALAPQGPSSTPITQEPGTLVSTPLPTETWTPTYTQSPTVHPTVTMGPTNTPNSTPGSIAGSISGYPYGAVPRLAIVAYGQEAPYNYGFVITNAGATYFENNSEWLIPGHYQVVAYDASGHSGGCPFNVLVISNETVTCDITNWGGGYRAKPSGVPNP